MESDYKPGDLVTIEDSRYYFKKAVFEIVGPSPRNSAEFEIQRKTGTPVDGEKTWYVHWAYLRRA